MVSERGRQYVNQLHETPAFGTAGYFELEELRAIMGVRRLPVDREAQCIPWHLDDLDGEWVLAPGADPDVRLLYLHGGGFVAGCSDYYLALGGRISAAAGCAVLVDLHLDPAAASLS